LARSFGSTPRSLLTYIFVDKVWLLVHPVPKGCHIDRRNSVDDGFSVLSVAHPDPANGTRVLVWSSSFEATLFGETGAKPKAGKSADPFCSASLHFHRWISARLVKAQCAKIARITSPHLLIPKKMLSLLTYQFLL